MEIEELKKMLSYNILDYYNKEGIKSTFIESVDFHLLLINYFEILRKKIEPKKRKVVISKQLSEKIDSSEFSQWKERFIEIKEMFVKGDDVNGLLSKKSNESDFRDRLLTCWKIHHLHFFPQKNKENLYESVRKRDKE